MRGEGALRLVDGLFLRLDRLVDRAVPEHLNPLVQTGAVTTTCLLIAVVTGVVLLLWYSPSVHQAHSTVLAMEAAPWTAGLVRSLHRYSSDGCLFFALVHALRIVFARRFTGARWLAWVTGIFLVGVLWLEGWLGYWLVWDERAQLVAVGTARLFDALPVFADPPSRSFLTDGGVNSLFFFLVFFVHVLLPLTLALAAWLHLARVARPKWITSNALTAWITGSLVVVSLLVPATAAAPARMTVPPGTFSMDWWYLAPLVALDRLSAGASWSLLLVGGAVLFSVPWTLARRRPAPAHVETTRCNACMKCFQDCPYDAIRMVPRTDERDFPAQASVLVDRCVGCGICAGSCDTAGIGLSLPFAPTERRRVEAWIDEDVAAGSAPCVALACADSAARALHVDEATGLSDALPGYRVLKVPCAGWIHPLTVERALRRGAEQVVVVSCGTNECRYREGARWIRDRLSGERAPFLRTDKIDTARVHVLELARPRGEELPALAAAARAGRTPEPRRDGLRRLAASLLVLLGLVASLVVLSDLRYTPPAPEGPELVVSFRHPGQVSENCRDLTPQELAARPVHMRQERICERQRAPVRLRVTIDGERVLERAYAPEGLWGDGSSTAVETLLLPAGEHDVTVEVGDTGDPDEWPHRARERLTLARDRRRVVLFDRNSGFEWH